MKADIFLLQKPSASTKTIIIDSSLKYIMLNEVTIYKKSFIVNRLVELLYEY